MENCCFEVLRISDSALFMIIGISLFDMLQWTDKPCRHTWGRGGGVGNSPAQRSVKFLMSMLVAFFARMEPASRNANPACISKMSEPMATRKKSSFKCGSDAAFLKATQGARALPRHS